MKRILTLTTLILLSIYSNASVTWSGYHPTEICQGSTAEYYIDAENNSNTVDIKDHTFVLIRYSGSSNENITDSYNIKINDKSPRNTNHARLTFSVKSLPVGTYEVQYTVYKGKTKKAYTRKAKFDIYDESNYFDIETDIEKVGSKYSICPEQPTNYKVELKSNNSAKTVSEEFEWYYGGDKNTAGLINPENTELTNYVSFYQDNSTTEYTIKATSKVCKGTVKEITVYKAAPLEVGDITYDSDIICSGGEYTFKVGERPLTGVTYNWEIIEGLNRVSTTTVDKNEFTVVINQETETGDQIQVKVTLSDGCNEVPRQTHQINISDIVVSANPYINPDQSTRALEVCYNAPNNIILGPQTDGRYPIVSWIWSDGTREEVLKKTFISNEMVSVQVMDNRGCKRTYEFVTKVKVPPTATIPWEQFCEGQRPSVNLEEIDEIEDYDISWKLDGSTAKKRSFSVNPGFKDSFDEIFTISYHTDPYNNTCVKEFTQHFELYEEPDFIEYHDGICYNGDLRLESPDGPDYTYQWNNPDNTYGNKEGRYYDLENIQNTQDIDLVITAGGNYGCEFTKNYHIQVSQSNEMVIVGGNEQNVCRGDNITLEVPDGFSNVTWHDDNSSGNSKTYTNVSTDFQVQISGDYGGCHSTATVEVFVHNKPNINLEASDNTVCQGQSIELTLKNNGSSVDENDFAIINWSNGASNRDNIFAKFENTDDVTCFVRDFNGCSATATKTINITPGPSVQVDNQYVCEGRDITFNAGQNYDSYKWWDGTTGYDISLTNVKAPITNAWVEVTDNGCSAVSYFEVQTFDIDGYTFEPKEICQGESVTLRAPSGFSNYRWQNGATSQTITVTPAKPQNGNEVTYICRVSDGDCEQEIEFVVIVNSITPFSLNNVTACSGELTKLSGPTGQSYDSYAWNYEGASARDLWFKTTRDFTARLTVWEGTCSYTASSQVIVDKVDDFNLLDKPVCENGEITYTAPPGYDYKWSYNGATTQSITIENLTQTTEFTVELENPVSGCKASDDFIVTVNSFIDFEVGGKEICQGADANLNVNPIYASYLWSTGETSSSINVNPVTLGEHQYSITVTDFNGCTGTATPTVNVLPGLEITAVNQEMCIGEFVEIGIEDKFNTYQWSNGSVQSKQFVSPNSTTNYTLTVSDNTGCEVSKTIQVLVHEPEEISLPTLTACQGDNVLVTAPIGLSEQTWNGNVTGLDNHTIPDVPYTQTINLTAKDAHGCPVEASTSVIVHRNPILNLPNKHMCKFETTEIHLAQNYNKVNWSNGSTDHFTNIMAQESESMFVTVEDINGCTATANFDINVYDYTPIDLKNQDICKDEIATIGLDGNNWVNYNWSNGKISQEITESPLKTTDYIVHAKDLNGCTSIGSMTLYVHEPRQYELPAIELCGSGTTTITADPGFTEYLWHTGETSQSIDFTASTNELVTLTYKDEYGCQGTTKKIAMVYKKPEVFLDDYTSCHGNYVDIEAPGGYTYLWDNGNTSRINRVSPNDDKTFTLIAIDNYGCRDTATSKVTVQAPPALNLQSYNVCYNEVINIDGGYGHNKYFWSNGVTGRFNTIKATEDRDYNLRVEDIFGCSSTATASVIVKTTTPLVLNNIQACEEDTIRHTAQSGFDSYLWSIGNQTGRTLNAVLSDYEKVGLTVTSANGCSQYQEANIIKLEKPEYFLAPEYVACDNQSVNVNVKPGYLRYIWNDGSYETNRTFWPVGAQKYTLDVEGVNGCITSKKTTIRESSMSDVYLADVLTCDGEYTQFSLTNSETLANVQWSTGETDRGLIYVKAQSDSIISVDYEDYNGCTETQTAHLILQPGRAPNLQDITICKGETRTIYAAGVYDSYKWSTGETTSTITVRGDYNRTISLEVADASGCTYESSMRVTVKEMPRLDLRDYTLCYTDTIKIGVVEQEGYSYQWNTGESTNFIKKYANADMQYILTITDNESSCSISDTSNVTVFPTPDFSIPSQFANKGETILLNADESLRDVQWSTGDTNYTITFVADTTHYITLHAIDENSCAINDEIYIYVAGDAKDMVFADTACSGQGCVLTARNGFRNYRWSTGETNRSIIKYDMQPKEYSVDITDHTGQVKTFSTQSNIKPGPQIGFGDTTLCYGDDLTLRIESGHIRYMWSNGEESNEVNFNNIDGTFDYSVLVESANGCITERNGTVTLHTDKYSIIGLKDTYEAGEQINISVSHQDEIESSIIYINGIEFNGMDIQTRLYNVGKIEVSCEVQAKSGCYFVYTDTITVTGTSSVISENNSNWLFMYPNPVEDNLSVQVGDKGEYTIIIYNSTGELLFNETHNSDIYNHDFGHYPVGMYILHVITDNNTYTNKIIKE